ncbi:hypothetical protein ACIGD1_34120 [Streptomyces sp. NPDC085612]|uniref:hypothetical protein n=1 Tax=Streptomyces sp. NPDC085612 TaxID=3365732 RepID=UPI0037D0EF5D
MTRTMRRALHGAVLATAALAATAPQAFAAAPVQQPLSRPPVGYVLEESFHGTAAACQTTGRAGIAQNTWTAYFCYQALPFSPFQQLYIKK